MSTTIDNKVVEMRFDNKQFESGVQTSLSTLDKLKQSLNLTGASKGLESINSAAKNNNMSVLGGAVEAVSAKFSALQVAGITALANITNSAVNTGKRMVSALTIDPIMTGFQEYETKIGSIQTIMSNTASKGTTMDDVTNALGELNTYADKTIYNFAEMTRNVGTFTAAGVDLETSTKAIQGIANLAAASGSSSQQASTAMYQLSQALSTGTVRLMDWNSVVNAGMGGELFQEALKETARRHGVAVDDMIEKNGSFRESLQEGWLSAEILTETLNNFTVEGATAYAKSMQDAGKWTKEQADAFVAEAQAMEDAATKVKTFTQLWDTLKESAQSGWSQTWEILIGDFEESRNLLTGISDYLNGVIGKSAEARNKTLTMWDEYGGRDKLIEGLKNAFDGLLSVIKPIKEAFREVFPPITWSQLVTMSTKFEEFTSKLKLNETQMGKLKSTFKGVFSVIDIGITFLKEFAGGIIKLIGNFTGLGNGVLDVTGSFGDWLSNLRDTIKETDVFGKAVDNVTNFLQKVIDKVKVFYGFLKEKLVMPGFEGFLAIMNSIWEVIQNIGKKIAEVGSSIGDALANAFRSGDISAGLDILNGGLLAGILLGVKKFIGGFSDAFGEGGLLSNVTDILDSVKGSLEAWQNNLQADTLKKIAVAIGILAASIVVLAMIDPSKLSSSLGAITVLFADLIGALALFNKIDANFTGVTKSIGMMIGMSVAVLILASALKKIASLKLAELVKGLLGVTGLMAIVVTAAKVMASDGSKIIKGAGQMLIMAAALKVLASVCEDLSTLSWSQLAKGLVGVGVLMAATAIFLRTAKLDGKAISTGVGMVVLAGAIKILASACSDFAKMRWDEIGKGLTSIGILFAEIAAFTRLTGNAGNVVATGIAMTIIGASMKIFASAVKDFSGMKWDEIGRGLTAMAGALAAVTLAVKFMPKNMISIGVGLIAVSAALVILSDVLGKMAGMSWEEIGRGMTVFGGSMAILAIGLNAMKTTLAGSAALLVAAVALTVLSPVLSNLGKMSWGEIAKGLVTIAGAFAIFGVAGYLLQPVIPAILSISAALALFGVSCLAIGVGVSLVSAGLTALAVAGTTGATAIVASLSIIVTGIAGLIPVIVERLGEAIILFCGVIAEGAPAIGEAVKALVLTIIDVLVECIPAIAEGILKLFSGVLSALVQYTPQIVDSIFQFLIALLEGVAKNLPALIQVAVDVIMAFFQGVVDALSGIDTEALLKGIAGVGLLSLLMIALAAVASLTPAAMVGVLGMGLVIAELALVIAAIGALAQIPGLEWLIGEGGDFLQKIGTAIGQFIGGIAGGIAEGFTSSLPEIGTNLSDFMTNVKPFIEGAKTIDESALTGVKSLVGMIALVTGASLLESIASFITGTSSMDTFGTQLSSFGDAIVSFSNKVKGNIDEESVMAAANAGKLMAEMNATIPGTGGVVQFFAGEKNLETFGTQLVAFGDAIVSFSNKVKGNVDEEAVLAAANAGKTMSEMQKTIPSTGGVVQFFTGEKDMATFGTQLVAFGNAIVSFSNKVKEGVDEEAVTAAATAGKIMIEMQKSIVPSGGVVQFFTGEQNLETFGTQIVAFGDAIVDFSNSVSGNIDEGAVTAAANAGKIMAELQSAIPEDNWFDGKVSLSEFGDELKEFGKGIAGYSEEVADIDPSAVSSSISAANRLLTLAQSLVDLDTSGIDNFKVKSIGDSLNDYYNKVEGIDSGTISSSISAANRLVTLINSLANIDTSGVASFKTALTNLGSINVDSFVSAFTSASSKLSGVGSNMIASLINGIKSKSSNLTTLGSTLMTNFSKGVNSKKSEPINIIKKTISDMIKAINGQKASFTSAGQQLGSAFVTGIKDHSGNAGSAITSGLAGAIADINGYYKSFESAGEYLVAGFVKGIDKNAYKAAAKAKAMAESAAQAAKRALDEHSPSKVFYKIGDYAGQGFVNALDDNISTSYKAGSDMAKSATNGLSDALNHINDILSNDMDTQPTIRPVLDLSNVSSGVSAINGMFDGNPSVGVLSNVGSISAMRNGRNRGGGDIISAIKDLKNSINNTSGNTYNINGITYDDGSNVANAVEAIVKAARVERRI